MTNEKTMTKKEIINDLIELINEAKKSNYTDKFILKLIKLKLLVYKEKLNK